MTALATTLDSTRPIADLLTGGSRYFFFTGKGGVGKTSLASATALALADQGQKTLLVSTDPASNLDEVLGLQLSRDPRPVPGVPHLSALNINPAEAARAYRSKVIDPLKGLLPEAALKEMEEQLSGACTMEIAAFDEFTSFLSGDQADAFAHIVFDTAPTGHTLRLMALSQAWTTFFDQNTSGNSCLGPLAGLEKKRELYALAVETLKDATQTRVVLVSRPQRAALKEALRSSGELKALGIKQQCMALNGLFQAHDTTDPLASQWEERQARALGEYGDRLHDYPLYQIPLMGRNLVGLESLRALYGKDSHENFLNRDENAQAEAPSLPGLAQLVDQLLAQSNGVIMTMGKGGVGKTTVAAALGLALAERGAKVRLSTTDPAAHLHDAFDSAHRDLMVERIDPKAETAAYVREVLAQQPADLDENSRALLEEDLRSPCTEEIAVFRAFARTVAQGTDAFVILDTAPTGHTLLLLDATQSYSRELGRQSRTTRTSESIEQLLPRLRDPDFTKVLIVTVPEATPVHEAAALQADLQRAGIDPQAWIINQSIIGHNTADPLLKLRGQDEIRYLKEITDHHAQSPVFLTPWSITEPTGEGLREIMNYEL